MNPEEIKKALAAIEAGDEKAALEILKALVASAASGGASAEPPPEVAAASESAEPPPADDAVAVAAGRELMRITATDSPGAALEVFASTIERVRLIDADRAAVELSERRDLVATLVVAGAETPATAWEGEAEQRNPKKRLLDEPIAELRERVKLIAASRGIKKGGHRPPPSDDGAPAPRALNRTEIAACKRLGITETEFNARKASAVRRV